MSPRIICRVKALYPFYSKEPSSLNFDKGDYIDVLAQLDSGWWDGWCGGARGWFPSNYVEVVQTYDDSSAPQGPHTQPHTVREPTQLGTASPSSITLASMAGTATTKPKEKRPTRVHSLSPPAVNPFGWTGGLANLKADSRSGPRLPRGWSEQLSEDGKTPFYYNHRTGKMQYEHPGSADSDSDYDSSNDDGLVDRDNDSFDSSLDDEEDYRGYQSRTIQNNNHHRHLSIDSLPANVITPKVQDTDTPGQIMAHWVERVTPQGRTYYCNLLTQETTWDANEIDKQTGLLTNMVSRDADMMEGYGHMDEAMDSPLPPKPPVEQAEPLTWQKLSSDIATAIHNLNVAAQYGERDTFVKHASAIVVNIRLLLYASRSLDKESNHMNDRVLREPHRAVMAALSKMVISVRLASENNATPLQSEALYKIQRDAGDVLASVRNFIMTYQEKRVHIQQVSPKLIKETVRSALEEIQTDPVDNETANNKRKSVVGTSLVQKARFPLNQDLLVSLETHANQISNTAEALSKATLFVLTLQREHSEDDSEQMDNSRDDSKARANVVALFRRLSMQTGQYIGILEDIDLSNIDGNQIPSLAESQVNKQLLYNAIGYLFAAVQAMSSENAVVNDCVAKIEQAIKNMVQIISQIAATVEDMVEQRKAWFMRNEPVDSEPPMSPTTASFKGEGGMHTATMKGDSSIGSASSGKEQRPTVGNGHLFQSTGTASDANERTPKRQAGARPKDERADQSELWYLEDDFSKEDIAIGQDGNVKGGTLPALVARLTPHDTLDTSFIATFLLTYRSFCTTEEFISQLEQRYNLRAPEGLMPNELEIWTERKQKLVRFRVFNVIKNWLENFYNTEDEFILRRLEFFSNTVIRDASPFSADQLNRLIRKRRELDVKSGLKKLVPNAMACPQPILPRDLSRLSLLEIDPLELSRQLTLIDFQLYSRIRPIECFRKAWSDDSAEGAEANNVKQSIDYCNRLTCWVTDSILANDEAKKRVVVIKHWAQVASRCRAMCNFNTCMAIISAFDNSAIGRLKKTWELVGNRTNMALANIRKLMGSNRNFQEYRELIHSVNPPCIPFLGIYLQDLTFIEDGNPDFIKKTTNLINFAKRQKAAEVIREINQFQSPSFEYQAVPEIQQYIKSHLESSSDVDALYERSLQLEPREPTA